MSTDPYLTPAASQSGSHANPGVTIGAIQHLAGTKPWVRLISVFMFIGAGFTLLGAAVFGIAGGAIFTGLISDGKNPAAPTWAGAGIGLGIAVVYGLFGLLYLYPAVKLWKYASRIQDLVLSGRDTDLVAALNEQRAFWKFVGILFVSMIALYLVGAFVVILAGGISAAASSHH